MKKMNVKIRLIVLLIGLCCIVSCKEEGHTIKNPKTELPEWVSVVNKELGEISVVDESPNSEEKKDYKFVITPKNQNINWEVYYNGQLLKSKSGEANWQGILQSVDTASETVKIIFVDGPIVSYLKDTNIPYRYDLSWEGTLTKEEVRRSYLTAIRNIENSNASELAEILRNVKKELFANKDDFANGYAYGDSLLKMNIKQTLVESYYATVWVHEIGHTYEALNPEITPELEEIYNNSKGKLLYPQLYYNTNYKEMWACAVASYVLNDPKTGGAHEFIANEPYYKETILPYLRKIFEK